MASQNAEQSFSQYPTDNESQPLSPREIEQGLRILQGREDSFHWVRCHLCDEEWAKLRPCKFSMPGEKVPSGTYVCVDCAEGVRALAAIGQEIGLVGCRIQLAVYPAYLNCGNWKDGRLQGLDEDERPRTHYYAIVSIGGRSFRVECRASAVPLSVVDSMLPEVTTFLDNAYQVMSFIGNKIAMVDDD